MFDLPHNFRNNYSSFRKSTNGNPQDNSQHIVPNFKYGRSSVNNEIYNGIKETFPAVSENINSFFKTSLGENAGIISSFQYSFPNKVENIVNTDHDKNISSIPFVPDRESRIEYLGNLYSEFDNFSPTFKPENEKLKLHKSHLSSHVKTDERIPNAKLYRQSATRNRNIETEALAEEKLHNVNGYEPQIIDQVGDTPSTTEYPDVSINVLEIPKITNKFENLSNRAKSNIAGQNNEDIRTEFEGFYDLRGNYPSSRNNQNLNSSIHQQLNGEERQQFLIPNSHTFTNHISSQVNAYDNLKHKSNVSYPHNTKSTTPREEILYTTSSPEHESIINTQSNYFNKINNLTATFYNNPNFDANNIILTDTTKLTALAEEFPYTISSSEHKRIINAPSNYINEVKELNATTYNNPNNRHIFQTFSHSARNSPTKQNAFSSNVISSNEFLFSNTLDKDRISEPNALNIIPKPYAIAELPTMGKSISIPSHRSDLPSENTLDENIDNNASSNSEINKDNIFSKPNGNNTNKYNLHTDIKPNLITEDETSPRRIRFQNVLRDFKPDKIIIDVGKLSTEQPPDSTSDFRHRTKTNDSPTNRTFNNVIKARDKQSEQSAGTTFRSHPIYITRGPRLRENHSIQKQRHNGVTFHVRKDVFPRQEQLNNSHQQGHSRLIYSRNEIPLQSEIVSAHQFRHPHQYDHQLQMNVLPPGVSMHPRHPQAPYANMVHANMIQSLPQSNSDHTSHRQRHHRKKDRFTNSCCKTTESSSTRQSCCRSGSSCCSGLRRTLPRTSCCSSKNNHNKQVHFPYRNQKQVQNDQPQPQVTGKLLDTRNRCQKEKMCRTVYESTQQVMVCRSVNIAGC
ncbi:probable serine/threonine-protein kinase DDB_G0276461 [Stegodyphus dumicola]|uniref:probable serine/threonine-protein kinase DDB_G0276461 n=1 Tax=Stegodyphus dumicola TaxID=202533 RepID=UPI0015AEC9A1|nr:probable serine/threonine-protein kinase DDB_G0276461 [Stegodyphus dumicola]